MAAFDLVDDPCFRISCTVTNQDTGITGKDNAMQYHPASDSVPWACLSALLTADGSIEAGGHVLGFVEVFRDGPIWIGWGTNTEITMVPADQAWLGNSVSGRASDGNRYAITLAGHKCSIRAAG
jgi:hypothetical protein